MSRLQAVFLCAVLALAPGRAGAQFPMRVDEFKWRVVETPHFQVHYTPESEPLLPQTAKILEDAYGSVTRNLNAPLKEKVPFFIFATHNRFEQNRIAPVGEGTGGVTEAFKDRIIVFNNGTTQWLRTVVTHEFVHAVQFAVFFGGFWRSVRLLQAPFLPLWFMEGLAEFETGRLDVVQEDMVLRDAATAGELYPLSSLWGFEHLKPHQIVQGYKQGAAAMRFLAQEFGRETPELLLKNAAGDFGFVSTLEAVTRQPMAVLDKRYLEHLTSYYSAQAEGLKEPEAYGQRLTPKDPLPVFYTRPALSPDGRKMAVLTDKGGVWEVMLIDLETGARRILAGRQWRELENIHDDGRALSYSHDGRWIAFTGEKKQRDFLYLYDTERNRLRRARTRFEQVRSPVFHPKENRLALVGMERGVNDLYEVDLNGNVLRRLTDSMEDESDPAYSPDGRFLAFSREAPPKTAAPLERLGRDLAAVRLSDLALGPLTDMRGTETSPYFSRDGRSMVFVGDEDGVPDLYRLDLPTGETRRLTRVVGGNFCPVLAWTGEPQLYFTSYRRNSRHVYRAGKDLLEGGSLVSARQPSAAWWAEAGGGPPLSSTETRPSPGAPAWQSAPFTRSPRRYGFRATTDIFFPLFYFSTDAGLFLGALWQASDMLGHHTLRLAGDYGSKDDEYDYFLQYEYAGLRIPLFLLSQGESFSEEFFGIERSIRLAHQAGFQFPFDRFHAWTAAVGTEFREDRLLGEFRFKERENFALSSLMRNTVTSRYLVPTAGHLGQYTVQWARTVFGGDVEYQTHLLSLQQFFSAGT
ncbi:MAG: PD40 domain-containing protein, partial [Elusimicrobia bacterium]|nr:PD40 domain-containing protein [Elusimicrobiota bacterium]